MALTYHRHEVRSPYRIRLTFSHALGAGAFVTSWFSIVSTDDLGTDPTVVAVLEVPGDVLSLELSLDVELAPGGAYELTISAGVPGATEPPLAADATQKILTPRPQPNVAAENLAGQIEALIYGQDLLHDGRDYVEQADGDLAILSGVRNATAGVERIAEGNGLPWSEDWGAHLREFVDSPSPSAIVARGQVVRAVQTDDRVTGADAVSVVLEDDQIGDIRVDLDVDLIGGQRESVSATVER
jgi:hypothetical protein